MNVSQFSKEICLIASKYNTTLDNIYFAFDSHLTITPGLLSEVKINYEPKTLSNSLAIPEIECNVRFVFSGPLSGEKYSDNYMSAQVVLNKIQEYNNKRTETAIDTKIDPKNVCIYSTNGGLLKSVEKMELSEFNNEFISPWILNNKIFVKLKFFKASKLEIDNYGLKISSMVDSLDSLSLDSLSLKADSNDETGLTINTSLYEDTDKVIDNTVDILSGMSTFEFEECLSSVLDKRPEFENILDTFINKSRDFKVFSYDFTSIL